MGREQRRLDFLHLGRVQLHTGLPDLHAVRLEAENKATDLQKIRNPIGRNGNVDVKLEHAHNYHNNNVVLQRVQVGQTFGDASKLGPPTDSTANTNGGGPLGKATEAKSVRLDLGSPDEGRKLLSPVSVDRTTEETTLTTN